MDWLRRSIAPLSSRVWHEVDEAVLKQAKHGMAARRVADFNGPHGWEMVAVRLGTMRKVPRHTDKPVVLSVPDVILLTELRAEFSLSWEAIESFERGGPVLDTVNAEEAGREIAHAEDRLVFYGEESVQGFLTHTESPRVSLGDWNQPGVAESDIVSAVATIDKEGIPGPYDLVLDPARYYIFQRATAQGGGYPAAKQLRSVLAGVYRSHVINGGALFSTRGDDFVMTVGGDLSIGYRWHDEKAVHLFCAETLAAQVLTPNAVCVLSGAAS